MYRTIRIPKLSEVLIMKKEDGNIHDRFACGVYLRAEFISLAFNIGGGVYLRAAFNEVNSVIILTVAPTTRECCKPHCSCTSPSVYMYQTV